MSNLTEEQEDLLRRANGLFTGQLSEEEMEAFNLACKLGLAERSYEGAAAFVGLAKVRLLRSWP